jgi:hypothetical protein
MVEFDPSGDFAAIMDGLEAVTLAVRGRADTTIQHAHRNQYQSDDPGQAAGEIRRGMTTWQWPASESPDRPPLGSVLVDSTGRRHTILDLSERVLSSKYSATCIDLAVEARLDNLVTIERATYTKNVRGEAVASWSVLAENVEARVQPLGEDLSVEDGRDTTAAGFEIILGRDITVSDGDGHDAIDPIGADYRLVDAAGNTFRVLRYQRPGRIDALPKILAVRA